MQHSEIHESASWSSVPPYFAALHTGYLLQRYHLFQLFGYLLLIAFVTIFYLTTV
jgi:hypothetical protein